MMRWIKNNWPLLVILAVSLGLRLYRIAATMTFLEDEGRDLLIVKRMLDTHLPVLLGPQTSTGNMYLGPLYYYLITPALIMSHMDPVGPAIAIAISGMLTTYFLYVLGKKWFSRSAGYVAALLFAILPYPLAVTRASWNPNLVPLTSVLMLLVFDKLVFEKSRLGRWWFAFGVGVGTMMQLHYMALVFCGILTLGLIWTGRREIKHLLAGTLLALVGFAMIMSPFFLFEVRNHWVDTKALVGFVTATREHNLRYNPPLWLYWQKFAGTGSMLIENTLVGTDMGNVKAGLPALVGFLLVVGVSLWVTRRKKHGAYIALVLMLIGSMLVLGFYQETIHPHYLEFGIPLVILLISPLFAKKLNLAILLLVLVLSVQYSLGYITSGPTHQAEKAKAVAGYITAHAGSMPYNVVSTQGTYTSPFQYFLAISDNPPSNTLQKRVFDICVGAPCPKDDETTTLLFLTGPSHPALASYLGHPQLNSFSGKRTMVSNEHVSYGIWVAEIDLENPGTP